MNIEISNYIVEIIVEYGHVLNFKKCTSSTYI